MKMFKTLVLTSFFICGVLSNSANVDTDSISSAVNELKNDVDLERFKDIKKPDDISQIKDWKNRCREEHGVETLKEIEAYPGELMTCVLQYVKPDKLQIEVNRSMARGNLDLVFKKYCGYREDILDCVDTMLDTFQTCMTPQQLVDVNVTRRAIDAAIDFTCHDDGDRIALFMAEQGVECVKEHKNSIRMCIEERVPSIKTTMDDPDSLSLDFVVINEQQCDKLNAMHDCIVQETTKCSDPTPANILDALIVQMLKVTPCWGFNARKAEQQQQQQAPAAEDVSSGAGGLGSLFRNSIAGIGPFLTSGFNNIGCASGFLGVLCLIMTQVHALILVIIAVCADFSSAVVDATSGVVSFFLGVLSSAWAAFYGSLQNIAGAYYDALKKDGAVKVNFDNLQNAIDVYTSASVRTYVEKLCILLYSQLSLSFVLVVVLAGVTAANLLL